MTSAKRSSTQGKAPLLKPGDKVFLSSTSTDSVQRRATIMKAVRSFGLECVAMEDFTASDEPPIDVCLEQVAECDALLGIIAHRYGSSPPGEQSSYTELEFAEAVRLKLPCLMFVIAGDPPPNPDTDIDEEKRSKLLAFKKRVASKMCRKFTDGGDLIHQVHATLQEKTGQKRQPIQVDPRDEQLSAYCDALLAEHRYLNLIGFGMQVRARLALEELFVPLYARVLGSDRDAELGGKALRDLADLEEIQAELPFAGSRASEPSKPLPRTVFSEAARAKKRVIVVLGEPGSGKTSQLRRLANSTVTRDADRMLGVESAEDAPLRPVFVSLRDLKAKSLRLSFAAVVHETLPAHTELPLEFCRWLIETRGHLLVLLDGLDEVAADLRDDVAKWAAQLSEMYPTCRFVLTSRHAGYGKKEQDALAPVAFELEMRPLSTPQIEAFVHRWYAIVERAMKLDGWEERAREAAEELLQRLKDENPGARRLGEMTSNPMLLTVICLIHRGRGGRLPRKRELLYREATEVLLRRWREAKDLKLPVDSDDGRELLEPVGEYLHRRLEKSATAAELEGILEAPLRAANWEGTVEEFLLYLRDESGIFCGESQDAYRFLHLGLQEYFTAREIRGRFAELCWEDRDAAREYLGELVGHFGESWWEEVLLLLLAIPERPYLFTPFFERLLATDPDRFAEHDGLVETAIDEARGVSPRPFAGYVRMALERTPDHPAVATCLRSLLLCEEAGRAALFERDLAEAIVLRADENWAEEITRLAEQHAPELGSDLRALLADRGSVTIRLDSRSGRLVSTTPGGAAFLLSTVSGIELVQIPGGKFLMGGTKHDNERPTHEVEISPFRLARTPVTNAQYARFLEANTGHEKPEYWNDRRFNGDTQPVVGVSWKDAQAYCAWAELRLPSEAEWEYACRAGTTTEYWFGDEEERLGEFGWFGGNSDGKLRAVGLKPASPFGLQDMHGNVWEWCRDSWHGNYKGAPRDGKPRDEVTGSGGRVNRGGCFGGSARYARSAFRSIRLPWSLTVDLGFRPAADLT